jgi:hypothetical protein
MNFGTDLFCGFAGILDFEARSFKSKFIAESKEASEKGCVHAPSKNLKPVSKWSPHVAFRLAKVTIESGAVLVHFFLRVDVFE